MSSECNRTYRRVIIINKKIEKVIIDECLIGSPSEENHLREIFANNVKLNGIKGDQIEVKTFILANFISMKT